MELAILLLLSGWSILSVTVVSSLFLKCPHDISHFHAYVEVLYSIESSLCVHLGHCIHDSAGLATTAFAQAIVVEMHLVILVDRVFRHCKHYG